MSTEPKQFDPSISYAIEGEPWDAFDKDRVKLFGDSEIVDGAVALAAELLKGKVGDNAVGRPQNDNRSRRNELHANVLLHLETARGRKKRRLEFTRWSAVFGRYKVDWLSMLMVSQ